MAPRQSASLILARDATGALEVLLVQRGPAQRVMAGFWVFPGGALDAGEEHSEAAVRELAEEAGVDGVRPQDLVAFSRWITPELIERRFDTHFFVARAPAGAQPRIDGTECVDLRWTTPQAALDAHADGEIALVVPTVTHLEQLTAFSSADELLEHARGREITPVQPRVVGGETPRIVLPGEAGY